MTEFDLQDYQNLSINQIYNFANQRSKQKLSPFSSEFALYQMNPFPNNQGSNDNNQRKNSSQTNPNLINYAQPYSNSIIQEEDVEMLLDNDNLWQSEQKSYEKSVYVTPSTENFVNPQQNQVPIGWQRNKFNQTTFVQPNQPNFFNQNQQNPFNTFNNQPQHTQSNFGQGFGDFNNQIYSGYVPQKKRINNARVSKLDDDIMRFIRENEENSTKPQNADTSSKVSSKLEEKSKKAVSRLSQNLFAKSGNPEDLIKSKRKNRHTIASFGVESKKNLEVMKDEKGNQSNLNRIQNQLLSLVGQPQKMEIEQTNQEKENSNFSANSPSKKLPMGSEGNYKPPQELLSEAKRKRPRLSFGIQGMQNLLKYIENEEKETKPQPQPVRKQTSRVTMDLSQYLKSWQQPSLQDGKSSVESGKEIPKIPNFGQQQMPKEEKEEKENTSTVQIVQTLKHLTEYPKPVIKAAEQVIPEDEKEDDITPIKSKDISHRFSFKKVDLDFLESMRKPKDGFFQRPKQKSQPVQSYTREVFNLLYVGLKDKIENYSKKCEELAKQKAQLIKDINNRLGEFSINGQNIAEWKQTLHEMRTRIHEIKQKVDKAKYEKNCQYINEFQLKLGIQIHKIARVQNDGFYVEFIYDDIAFRIQRSQRPNQTKTKLLYHLVDKKVKKDFEFSFEERTELIQAFINRKLKKVKRFIPFIKGLVQYTQALQMFEYSIVQFAYTTNLSNLQLTEKKTEMEFYITVASKFEFLFTVDLMELLNDGGITVFSVYDGKHLDIPEEICAYNEKGNKVGRYIIFMERYVAELMRREIDKAVKIK